MAEQGRPKTRSEQAKAAAEARWNRLGTAEERRAATAPAVDARGRVAAVGARVDTLETLVEQLQAEVAFLRERVAA